MSVPVALSKELAAADRKEARLARIAELEDRVNEIATGVVEAALSFHEVTPTQTVPPVRWIAEYGPEGAQQRLMVARSQWMPPSVAPVGPKLAVQVMIGIARGRGYKVKLTQNVLNVKIELPAPTSSQHPSGEVFPVKDIE